MASRSAALALSLLPLCAWAEEPAPAPAPQVQLTSLDIDLTIDPATGTIRELATLGLQGTGASRLVLRIDESFTVERSRAGSGIVEHRKAGDEIVIEMDPPLAGAGRLTLEITGQPRAGEQDLIGPVWAVLGPDHGWYPRLDDRAVPTTVTVRVPAGWTAVAPGRLHEKREGAVWRYSSDTPIRSVAVAAGRGWTVAETRAVQVPVRLVGPPGGPDPARIGALLSDPMAWFAGALAPYPYEGFTLVRVGAFAGRVRASGMLVVGADTPLDGAADAADLLAGQWWGEVLGGDGAWIDAFASWHAATYARDRTLPLPSEVARLRRAYFELPRAGDVPVAAATHLTPPEVVRGKGSAIPDMIRLVVGDRAFFAAVTDLFERESLGRTIGLADVRRAIEQRHGGSIGRVHGQWWERADVPELRGELRTLPASTGGFRVDLTLIQVRAAYTLPVEVVFLGPGVEHREVVEIEGEQTSVMYVLPFEPARVEIDPANRIFRWPAAAVTR